MDAFEYLFLLKNRKLSQDLVYNLAHAKFLIQEILRIYLFVVVLTKKLLG